MVSGLPDPTDFYGKILRTDGFNLALLRGEFTFGCEIIRSIYPFRWVHRGEDREAHAVMPNGHGTLENFAQSPLQPAGERRERTGEVQGPADAGKEA